jgi:hypothetical protein
MTARAPATEAALPAVLPFRQASATAASAAEAIAIPRAACAATQAGPSVISQASPAAAPEK